MVCNDCPRQCNIDRSIKSGYCNVTDSIKVARAALHYWEEPCISGTEGSGAVFFSGCNMHCVFCQNSRISDGKTGEEITTERLAEIFIELQAQRANNINLVTPSHYVNQIIDAVNVSRAKGLSIPIVYNSSSYEKKETLRRLKGYVDVYLPDCKYYDDELATAFSHAPNYHSISLEAIAEMLDQVGEPVFDNRQMIVRGVIVRVLVLPGHTKDAQHVLASLYDRFGNRILYSVMNQYTPLVHVEDYPELNRKLTKREYKKVIDYALGLGIENGFMQEGDVAKESFIPNFDLTGVK